MTSPRFMQIHTLHSYPATLLNRDDSGLAKRMPFGDAVRTRISSQCLKRHWRVAEDEFSLTNIEPDALRSRNVIDRTVMQPLRDVGDVPNGSAGHCGNRFQYWGVWQQRHVGKRKSTSCC